MRKSSGILLLLALLVGLWTGAPRSLWACSCVVPGSPAEELAAADAVFSGVVTAVEEPLMTDADSEGVQIAVQFRVLQVWKGEEANTLTVTTPRDSAACGYHFEREMAYLVYAHQGEHGLDVNLCSRTQPLDQAGADIAALDRIEAQPQSPLSPLPMPHSQHGQSPLATPSAANSPLPAPATTSPLPTPIAASALDGMELSYFTSHSVDGEWVAERLVGLPESDESQYYTQLAVQHLEQMIQWIIVAGWQDFGLGYTIPEPLRWSEDGRYLYFTNRPIVDGCAPFANGTDLHRLDLMDGSVEQLLASVTFSLALSPDEETVAYRSQDGMALMLYDLKTDEETSFEVDLGDENDQWGALVWAPDGRSLVYTVWENACGAPANRRSSIIQMDATNGEQTILIDEHRTAFRSIGWTTNTQLILLDPNEQQWAYFLTSKELSALPSVGAVQSPDGHWQAWPTGEPGKLQIETSSAGQTIVHQLNFQGVVDQIAWLDSRRLIIVETNRMFTPEGQPVRPLQPTRLWQVELSENNVHRSTLAFSATVSATESYEEGIVLGSLSPDGRYLLFWTDPYFSISALADGTPLWMLDIHSGQSYLVAGEPPLGEDSVLLNPRYHSWSPDSSALAITVGGYRSAQVNKWLAIHDPVAVETTVAVSKSEQIPGIVTWSPDGDLIAYAAVVASETGPEWADLGGFDNPAIDGRRIYLLDPTSGEYRRLNDVDAFQDAPLWSEDGESLYYVQREDNMIMLMVADPETGEAKPVPGVDQPAPDGVGYYGQSSWDHLLLQAPVQS